MKTTAQNVLVKAIQYISSNDLENFQSIISLFPLDTLNQEAFDSLFVKFITAAHLANAVSIAQYILALYSASHDVMTNAIPYDTYIFFLFQLDDSIVSWIAKVVEQEYSSAVYHLTNLLNYDPSETTLRAAQRVINIFGTSSITQSSLKELLDKAQDQENGKFIPLLLEIKSKISDFLPKPNWVSSSSKENKTETELLDQADKIAVNMLTKKVQILPIDDAVEFLTAGLNRQGISTEEMEEATDSIRQLYAGLTNAQRINLLSDGEKTKDIYYLHDDTQLFRILGPTNMLIGVNLAEDHECCRYGGCRMMLCRCFERYDEDIDEDVVDESDEVDWFTGICLECGNNIRHRWYACRRPMISGGWSGCYCSWKCVSEASTDMLQLNLIKINEANMNSIGIEDRIEDT